MIILTIFVACFESCVFLESWQARLTEGTWPPTCSPLNSSHLIASIQLSRSSALAALSL